LKKHNIKQLKNRLYPQLWKKYGAAAQMAKLAEECAELVEAYENFKNNPCQTTEQAFFSEVADVCIASEQIEINFSQVKKHQEFKLLRQMDREGLKIPN